MAFHDITYSCGHFGRVQINGTDVHGERKRTAAAMAERDCPDCVRETARSAAADRAEEAGLPVLVGSEKQVAWAMVLRDTALRNVGSALESSGDTLADVPARARIYREILTGVDAAARWIDQRALIEHPVPALITALADETGRALLVAQTGREFAALAAAATDPGIAADSAVGAGGDSVASIAPASGQGGPVLEVPDPVWRALKFWCEVRDTVAEPARITRLRPVVATALSEPTLTAHLLRLAVRSALAEPATPGDATLGGAAAEYTAAAMLLAEYRRHDTGAPAPQPPTTDPVVKTSSVPWWVRARVRVLRETRCGARTVAAGEVLELIQYGLAGWPVPGEAWWDTDPATALDPAADLDEVFCIDTDRVEVLEVLAESTPR